MDSQVVKWRRCLPGAAAAVGVAFLLALTGAAFAAPPSPPPPQQLAGTVTHVADGDTFTLRTPSGAVHVRLSGVDAPEAGQAWSRRARSALAEMLSGTTVTATCSKTEVYGREVCRVVAGGRDVGLALVEAGLAWHFKRYTGEQPIDERQTYAAAEEAARAAQRGLWSAKDPQAPWECREAKRSGLSCR